MCAEPVSEADLPGPAPYRRRTNKSNWALLIVLGFVVIAVVGVTISLLTNEDRDEPWRIDYPGVKWVAGDTSHTPHTGKPYLRAIVQFDTDVLSAAQFKDFLAELLRQTPGVYELYFIKGWNRREQYVIHGTVREDGTHSIETTPLYEEQGSEEETKSPE